MTLRAALVACGVSFEVEMFTVTMRMRLRAMSAF
jgi:hypothetical protein